jgi:glycosyltransferase involved in cell wall biosynthesis
MNVHLLDDALDLEPGRLWTFEGLPQDRMHTELARRRVYVHTSRWTSLGLSLLEAMHLGMPVVALAATEAVAAVPPEAGVLTTRPDELVAAVWRFAHDPEEAHRVGAVARQTALARYGLGRFLADWDARIDAWAAGSAGSRPADIASV